MLKYICGDDNGSGLIPHKIQNTVSINEARRVILLLSKPLADITQSIQDNIVIMARHEKKLKDNAKHCGVLKSQLFIPTVDLVVKELNRPATVCTAVNCCDYIMVIFHSIKRNLQFKIIFFRLTARRRWNISSDATILVTCETFHEKLSVLLKYCNVPQ